MEDEAETILKSHTLLVDIPSGETTQAADEWLGTPETGIEPPVPLDALLRLSEMNSVRTTCIDAVARNVVGLGYSLEPEYGRERDITDPAADIDRATSVLETLAARDRRLEHPTFTQLLFAVKKDEETVGQGGIEVSRDKRTGEITGLYHVPGYRIRRRKDRDGYLVVPVNGNLDDTVTFYEFGDKVNYTSEGKPTPRLLPGRAWSTNELLTFKLYSPETRDYGMPRDVSMALEYAGDKQAAQSNLSFFDSSGTPPTVIFVQGQEERDGSKISFRVPQQTVDNIANTLKAGGNVRSRVAIIPVPPGTQAKEIKLGEISDRDMGFVAYRADNSRRALAAFKLQPIFIPAIEDTSRYTAEVQRAITLEQLFDPEQRRYAARLGETVLREIGFPDLRIVFRRLAVEDDASRRDSADKLAENGAITRRELRKAHGFAPLPEAAEGGEPDPGQVPFGWNDELVEGKNVQQDTHPDSAEPGTPEDTRGLQDGLAGRPVSPRARAVNGAA